MLNGLAMRAKLVVCWHLVVGVIFHRCMACVALVAEKPQPTVTPVLQCYLVGYAFLVAASSPDHFYVAVRALHVGG
jgi:hypothetical protein